MLPVTEGRPGSGRAAYVHPFPAAKDDDVYESPRERPDVVSAFCFFAFGMILAHDRARHLDL